MFSWQEVEAMCCVSVLLLHVFRARAAKQKEEEEERESQILHRKKTHTPVRGVGLPRKKKHTPLYHITELYAPHLKFCIQF